jgi:hypothetical protein
MKLLLNVFAFIILPFIGMAQECNMYFPDKKGAELTYTYFTKPGKPESSSKVTVANKSEAGGKIKFDLIGESFDKKGNSVVKFEYSAWCENGDFFIDMKSMMGTMNLKDMGDFKIESTNMQFPSHMTAGQTLNDASISLTVDGPVSMGMNTKITDRKVEGFESVTTPAGTFECVKISYKTFAKVMIIKTEGNAVEWYSKNVGLIRSETYDKKMKLTGYSELTSIK